MNGTKAFFEGLTNLTGTILRDAAGISQLRVQSAKMKAQADIGLLNAQFLAKIDSYQIRPEDFESAFEEHRKALSDLAANTDFGPARGAVDSMAQSTLPQLYTAASGVMNKVQLNKAAGEYASSLQSIRDDKSLSADERWDRLSQNYDQAPLFMDKTKIVEAKAADYRAYRSDKAEEVARSQGSLQDAVDFLYDKGRLDSSGLGDLTAQERDAVAIRLGNELTAKSNQAYSAFQDFLKKNADQYIDAKAVDDQFSGLGISDAMVQKIKAETKLHNDDTLYTGYLQRINNTENVKTLTSIMADLRGEGSWAQEYWVGDDQEKRRAELLRMVEGKIADLTKSPDGSPSQEAANFSRLLNAYKQGIPLVTGGQPVSWGECYSAADRLLQSDKGNAAYKAAKDDLETFIPSEAKTAFESLRGTIRGQAKGFWKEHPEDSDFAYNAFQTFAKNNPTASAKQFSEEATRIQAQVIAAEMDYKKQVITDGLKVAGIGKGSADSQLIAFGAKAQAGEFGGIVNDNARQDIGFEVAPGLAPVYSQWSAWEKAKAATDYGLDLMPVTQEDGSQVLEDGSGNKYRFKYDAKAETATLLDAKGRPVASTKPAPAKPAEEGSGVVAAKGTSSGSLAAVDKIAGTSAPSSLKRQALQAIAMATDKQRASTIKDYIAKGLVTEEEVKELGFKPDGTPMTAH